MTAPNLLKGSSSGAGHHSGADADTSVGICADGTDTGVSKAVVSFGAVMLSA